MYSLKLILLYFVLLLIKPTRKIALALLPWLLFACSYDWMRLIPNYEVNSIDLKGLYEAEKNLFGITTAEGTTLIPGEYFAIHHNVFADIIAGISYLCWVPVPLAFAFYLYYKKEMQMFLRFSIAFLFVNLLGFVGYYIHPAAPPWYVMEYGFEAILNTPGSVAGLDRFDTLTGIPFFHSIYCNNSNVFAAVPSLHATYMMVTTFYAYLSKQRRWVVCLFALICIGIWFTAVYSGHHYIIDVVLGILTAVIGLWLLEKVLFKIPAIKSLLNRYTERIS